jgi:hypothetical protein
MPAPVAEKKISHSDSSQDSQHLTVFANFLQNYHPQHGETKKDTLAERYQIDSQKSLPEFSTPYAQAYVAKDITDGGKKLFALVCHPEVVARHATLRKMQSSPHPRLLPLLATGPIWLSHQREERFALIYPQPQGKSLAQCLTEKTLGINEVFLMDAIISPLVAAIEHLSLLGITHGAINPHNIYFGENVILGDCCAGPCGASQDFFCETVERLQSMPLGKGEGNNTHDYYALAALVLYLLHGPDHFSNRNPDEFITAILREGAHAALTNGKSNPDILDDFLHGILCQHSKDRWDATQIKAWLSGKRFNVLRPPLPSTSVRPFELGTIPAYSRREVAYVLHNNPSLARGALDTGQLAQWIAVSLRDKEFSETILRLGKTAADLSSGHDLQYNEYVMHILLLLDPEGPIRLGSMAFHIDGVDSLFAYLAAEKSEKDLLLLTKFIEMHMASYWLEQKQNDPGFTMTDGLHALFTKLEKLRASTRNLGLGFGVERILYELNPEMPCQSPFFDNRHIVSLPVLLMQLDQLAPAFANGQDPMDRHIAAFIACKLGIQHEIRLHDLAAIPALAAHRSVLALKLLVMAQEKSGIIRLPGLAHWLALRIAPTLEYIRSRTLRQKIKAGLLECVRSGSAIQMASVIINPGYAAEDHNGFSEAWNTFHENAKQIKAYRAGENIDALSERLGLEMAKFFAYGALAITLFVLLRGNG